MTTQIAVRLPNEIVDFLDDQVHQGTARSRAEFVSRAIRRERRRLIAEHDAEIYAAATNSDDDDDLAALVAHTSRRPLDQLD